MKDRASQVPSAGNGGQGGPMALLGLHWEAPAQRHSEGSSSVGNASF
jgi:hypothetical protein